MRRVLGALVLALAGGAALAQPDEACTGCHKDDAAEGAGPFPLLGYRAGVHRDVECAKCHRRAEGAFDEVPHRRDEPDLTRCTLCHGLNLKAFRVEHRAGVHGDMDCAECHDAHTMRGVRDFAESEERTAAANASCLRCHPTTDLRGAAEAHDWLPNPDRHARMRCMACHAPLGAEHDHEIVPAAQATRSCDACHSEQAPLVEKYVGEDDRSSWITNPVLFERAYVPGAVRHRLLDGIVLAVFALAPAGALAHGLLRLVARARRAEAPFEVVTIDLYPRGLRRWHWANAVLVVVLSVTGLRLHFGGREDPILSFETAFDVHNLAGVALVLLAAVFYVRAAVTGDARQYLGRPQDGLRGLLRQAGFYVRGVFRGGEHPYHPTPERRFNPLQKVAYGTLMYGLFPLLIATGIVLLFPQVLPDEIGGRPGVWWFATVHYLSGAGVIAFLLGHVYLATTGDRVRYLFSAMVTGRHRHHVRKGGGPGER